MLVVLSILVVLFFLSNIYFFQKYNFYRNIVKQKGIFKSWNIPKVSLEEIDPIFKTNHLGVSLEAEVKLLGRGHLNVPGGASDTESWILSVLAKKAANIFEFGTCTGKTTYLLAANSPKDTKITSITLAPEQVSEYIASSNDNPISIQDAKEESAFTEFIYNNTPEEKKIVQLFGDSKQFNEDEYIEAFDLIFVDGSHAYSYVVSDSQKALKMIKPGGLILWHDYRGPYEMKDVYKALNELSEKIKLSRIPETSLVIYRHAI